MQSVFDDYADYYDLLYRDKDYQGETDAIVALLDRHGVRPPARIVEFGCGTGIHGSLLAQAGFHVVGIELSSSMARRARERETEKDADGQGRFRCVEGDIRNCQVEGKFDAALSLFHVVSYLTTERDLHQAFDNVRRHLVPGGAFLCDVWHLPGVLRDPPQPSSRALETPELLLTRRASPLIVPEHAGRITEVHYELEVTDRDTGETRTLTEVHTMRAWEIDELAQACKVSGLELAESSGGFDGEPLVRVSWNALIVARETNR